MTEIHPPEGGDGSAAPSWLRRLPSLLLAGLGSVIPVLGTVWLLALVFRILLGIGDRIIDIVLAALNFMRGPWGVREPWVFQFQGAGFVRFALPVLILLAVGAVVKNAPGRRAFQWIEGRMSLLPVVGFIYRAIKQFVDAVRDLGGSERRFKGVAFVEYPSPGCRLLGFVTGSYREPQTGRKVTAVFLPTAPNPLTGFVVIVDEDKVMASDMTMEEATKMIISAGIVAPGTVVPDAEEAGQGG